MDAGHWTIRTHPEEIATWVGQVVDYVEDGSKKKDLDRWRLN